MRKIANTSELQGELQRLLDIAGSYQPSRVRLAAELRALSVRVAHPRAGVLRELQIRGYDLTGSNQISKGNKQIDAWVNFPSDGTVSVTDRAARELWRGRDIGDYLDNYTLPVNAPKRRPLPPVEPTEDELAQREQEYNKRDLKEMEALLKKHGYKPSDAQQLQDEGMSAMELEDRLRHKPGQPGSLEVTHGLQPVHSRTEAAKLKCEMRVDCDRPATYTDGAAIYCAEHAKIRSSFRRCRKLKPSEIKNILAAR